MYSLVGHECFDYDRSMKGSPNIARIGALLGDPARAAMLEALMDGRALTATELARVAGISPQTASSHLSHLVQGTLLVQRRQGLHKYFALASESVAELIESMMNMVPDVRPVRTGPGNDSLRLSRVCYNHLAGDRGVQMFDSLVRRQRLVHDAHNNLQLTQAGEQFVASLGIDLSALTRKRAPLCRECLDWSERRSHLAGSLGRALLAQFESSGWARRMPESRVIKFTPRGRVEFDRLFPPR